MVKFAHMADVHLGSWRDPKMKQLSVDSFKHAIDTCVTQEVDFLLIAGDLFNNALPSIDIVKECVKQLKRLKHKNIPVYVIGGSHDYAISGKTMLDVLEEAELMVNVMKGTVENNTLNLKFTHDLKTEAKLTGIMGKRGMLDRAYYEQLELTRLEAEAGLKIFLFHTALSELTPKNYDGMQSAPLSLLPKGFTYYAGGHVHYILEKDEPAYGKIVFPGPLFPANFAELEELKQGGFWIYDNGQLLRQNIPLKEITAHNVDLTNKTAEESMHILLAQTSKDCKDHVVLLRLHGQLKGKTNDLDYRALFQQLYANGAYFVMKNTSKLISEEMNVDTIESKSPHDVEDALLRKHQSPDIGVDHVDLAKKLLDALDSEKHEGEKVSDYEDRIKKQASEVLGI